jgi:hypothetical protein
MESPPLREQVLNEIRLIPEEKLSELYEVIHDFRLELSEFRKPTSDIMKFAGCWQELPENVFNEFSEDIVLRRKKAFLHRRNRETSTD